MIQTKTGAGRTSLARRISISSCNSWSAL